MKPQRSKKRVRIPAGNSEDSAFEQIRAKARERREKMKKAIACLLLALALVAALEPHVR